MDPDATRYNPIIVDETYRIIDGQHRFEALKSIDLPIYFVKQDGLGLKEVQALNANTKNWSPVDYARSYAELGNENYKIYLNFKKKYKLNHDVLMKYLSLKNPITSDSFKAGKLKVGDIQLSAKYCDMLSDMGQYYDRYKQRAFALGFLRIIGSEAYDHERMLSKFKSRTDKIEGAVLAEDYAHKLEKIFNHGLTLENKVRLY